MDTSGISASLLHNIASSATQNGDAVSISMMRKAMDIQASQASQLIDSVAKSMPDPAARIGANIDVRV